MVSEGKAEGLCRIWPMTLEFHRILTLPRIRYASLLPLTTLLDGLSPYPPILVFRMRSLLALPLRRTGEVIAQFQKINRRSPCYLQSTSQGAIIVRLLLGS